VHFSERAIVTPAGPRVGLVITPLEPIVFDRVRLTKLRMDPAPSELDLQVRREVLERRGHIHFALFRGKTDDGRGLCTVSEHLGTDELEELGCLLMRQQIVTYRYLARAGACVHVRTEWDDRASDMFAVGTDRLIDDIVRRSNPPTPTDELDLWCLKHFTFTFALSFERVMKEVLPEKFTLLERRSTRIKKLLDGIAPETLDDRP